MGQNQTLMRFLIGGSIAFLLLSLVACSSSNPASPSCPSGKNFLAYPGSSLDYSGQSGGFIVSEYTSSDSVGKIYSFYINSLAGAGWKVRLTQNLTQTANLSILCSKNPSM